MRSRVECARIARFDSADDLRGLRRGRAEGGGLDGRRALDGEVSRRDVTLRSLAPLPGLAVAGADPSKSHGLRRQDCPRRMRDSRSFVIDWSSVQPTTYETGGMYAALPTRGSYGRSDRVYALWK